MQLTKKTVLWAESGTVEKPNDVKIEAGWTGIPAEQPPARWFNWILYTDETNINDLIDSNNAINTELSSVITAGGLVPDLSPTGPGDQLLEALQTGEVVGNGGISDVSLDKLTPGIFQYTDPTDGLQIFFTVNNLQFERNNEDNEFEIDAFQMRISDASGGLSQDAIVNVTGDGFRYSYSNRAVRFDHRGINYYGSSAPGTNFAKGLQLREASFDIVGATWNTVVSSATYATIVNLVTDIPAKGTQEIPEVIRASLVYSSGSGVSLTRTCIPVTAYFDNDGSDFLRVTSIVASGASAPASNSTLILFHSGSTVGP